MQTHRTGCSQFNHIHNTQYRVSPLRSHSQRSTGCLHFNHIHNTQYRVFRIPSHSQHSVQGVPNSITLTILNTGCSQFHHIHNTQYRVFPIPPCLQFNHIQHTQYRVSPIQSHLQHSYQYGVSSIKLNRNATPNTRCLSTSDMQSLTYSTGCLSKRTQTEHSVQGVSKIYVISTLSTGCFQNESNLNTLFRVPLN